MNRTFWFVLMIFLIKCMNACCNEEKKEAVMLPNNDIDFRTHNFNRVGVSTQSWQEALRIYPTVATWSVQTSIPMSSEGSGIELEDAREARGKKYGGMKKKMKKYMVPLLIAYKLKFFTLIPVMIGGLVLLTGATGLAGFFFALFAAVMGLKTGGGHDAH